MSSCHSDKKRSLVFVETILLSLFTSAISKIAVHKINCKCVNTINTRKKLVHIKETHIAPLINDMKKRKKKTPEINIFLLHKYLHGIKLKLFELKNIKLVTTFGIVNVFGTVASIGWKNSVKLFFVLLVETTVAQFTYYAVVKIAMFY
jgi:hypothetical protein